jgi:triosephosphate isomerase
MKKLIAGNWKMNGLVDDAVFLAESISREISDRPEIRNECEFLVCPPYLHLSIVREVIDDNNSGIFLGAQDCALTENGAYTGSVSAEMIADMGCSYVILGHSERREYQNETDEIINQKAKAAHKHGLITIICVGEVEAEREEGREYEVVAEQLTGSIPDTANKDNLVIAYEPVWAIGTGKTATPSDAAAMHKFIREKLQEKLADFNDIRILYGGSMKPDNAAGLFAEDNIDGGLIGGASLKSEAFVGIGEAAINVVKAT